MDEETDQPVVEDPEPIPVGPPDEMPVPDNTEAEAALLAHKKALANQKK